MVTNEVKRRLDYQIALQDLHHRMEQEHMVNWVEKSVIGSITPQQVGGPPPAEAVGASLLLRRGRLINRFFWTVMDFSRTDSDMPAV